MDIVIRVDASRAIGSGHVKRMRSLAFALAECGADVRFVVRDHGLDIASMIAPWPVIVLPATQEGGDPDIPHGAWAGARSGTDAAQTVAMIGKADWIVIDHYGYDARWHSAVRASTGARIAVIDDLADRAIDADLVVDHNWHADHAVKYAGRALAPILGGPRFALLGPSYVEAARYVTAERARSVGVFMGGIDAANATMVVLDALEPMGLEVEVVTTSANPHLHALRDRCGMRLSIDLPDLASFFARHDIQVGAGGGASWERCCIGAPTVSISVASNQEAVVAHLFVLGAVDAVPLDRDVIAGAVTALANDTDRRARMSTTARMLVDGNGARRVGIRLTRDTLSLRLAAMTDARLMHAWRNDPLTRTVSHDSRPIPWDTHLSWLERRVSSDECRLLIAHIGEIPVGVIRFDLAPDGAMVSLYLDPALHGLGLGGAMLRAGENAVSGLDILAEVLEGNATSSRMFASAGYAPNGPGQWIKRAQG